MNIEGIEALTLPALSAAMDAALIRQQVIANNIANANTQDFSAHRVSFDVVMDSARNQDAVDAIIDLRLQPRVSPSADGAVRLDSEVAAMSQNGAHYQALLKALNRQLSVLASAVTEGKR